MVELRLDLTREEAGRRRWRSLLSFAMVKCIGSSSARKVKGREEMKEKIFSSLKVHSRLIHLSTF